MNTYIRPWRRMTRHLGTIFAAAALSVGAAPATLADERPNVLLIVADDATISDYGFAGSGIRTPNIDKLAEMGTLFTRFHAAPVCSVSRAMLLTGNDPIEMGLATFDYAVYPEVKGVDGYETYLTRNAVAVQELLQDAGYMTMMVGKWHLGGKAAGGEGPHEWGFDRSYGVLSGGSNHWNSYISIPNLLDPKHAEMVENGEIPLEKFYENGEKVHRPDGVFSDDLWTSNLMRYLQEAQDADKPFFAYVAYTTPHVPVQAPAALIDTYVDQFYEQGFEGMRELRWQRQKDAGLIPNDAPLSPWENNPLSSSWDDLDEDAKQRKAREMATYAAMMESQDTNIGRILDYLREIGELDNTLIIYMSDNGPEGQGKVGPLSRDVVTDWVNSVSDPALEAIGRGDVWAFTGTDWTIAQLGVMNWFKWFIGEGGVRVPAIVVPPNGTEFARAGERTATFATVKDLPATILDYAGVDYPGESYKGRDITPASGSTLRSFLKGEADQPHDDTYRHVFELFGNGYVVQGNYKAMMIREGMWGDGEWHLYDIRNDPGETIPLDDEMPELLAELKAHFESYRDEKGLVPVAANWSPWFGFVDLETFLEN